MKRTLTTTLMALLLCVTLVFGLTACSSGDFTQDDIDKAVNEAKAHLNERITALEADIADKAAKITTLEGEKTALAAEKTELLEDIAEIEAEVTALETEKATLEASITAKDNEIATLNASISSLNTEKATLTTRVSELEASISAKDAEIADLSSSITTLQTEKQALTDRVAELEGKNEALESEKSELVGKNEALESEKSELVGKNEALESEKSELVGKNEALESEKSELEKEKEILKNCVEGIHSYTCTDNGDGTHTEGCICGKEVTDTHDIAYIDNGDGTHSLACQYCDYVDTDTTEEHYEYVSHSNCVCSLCGAEHYLPYVDEGDCSCRYCGEDIHSIDENCVCTVCSLSFHTVDPTTGVCSECNNFAPAASITDNGVATYYSTFDDALNEAMNKNGSTIVLESDCYRDSAEITGGNIVIDLNGKTLGCGSSTSYSLVIRGGNVTVKDSAGGGKSLRQVGAFGGTTTLEGGNFNLIICSDSGITNIVGGEYREVAINDTNAKLAISGGSFEMVTSVKDYFTLDQLLDEGCCYYDADGNAIDISTIEPNGYWYELTNVTVGAAE